jgi:hypothetical protein
MEGAWKNKLYCDICMRQIHGLQYLRQYRPTCRLSLSTIHTKSRTGVHRARTVPPRDSTLLHKLATWAMSRVQSHSSIHLKARHHEVIEVAAVCSGLGDSEICVEACLRCHRPGSARERRFWQFGVIHVRRQRRPARAVVGALEEPVAQNVTTVGITVPKRVVSRTDTCSPQLQLIPAQQRNTSLR